MVTGASLRPSAISGSSPGAMISSMEGLAITSRRPTALVGCSLKGLKDGWSGVAEVVWSAAATSPPASVGSVGPSPAQPASMAATVNADRVWRPGNAPLLVSSRSSALQNRGEGLVELVERGRGVHLLAIDEEGRRGVDAEGVGGTRADGRDVVQQLLVGEALLERLLGETRLLGDFQELGLGVAAHEGPLVLLGEERGDEGERLAVARAAGEHRGRSRQVVQRELAHDEA